MASLLGGQKATSIIATRIAWVAGRKLLGYMPQEIQDFISGNKITDEIYKDYIKNNISDSSMQGASLSEALFFNGSSKELTSYGSAYGQNNNVNGWFGETEYVVMGLEIIGDNTILLFPCVSGFPRISYHTAKNNQPIATNKVPITTNRRVEPSRYYWEFPVKYLRVYGSNNNDDKVIDTRNSLQKFKDGVSSAINAVENLSFDTNNTSGQQQKRQIPTYAEIITYLKQFQTQFGCYLYLGLGVPRIEVTADIDIETQKGDLDCVYVRLTCTETQTFDFVNLKATNSIGINNVSRSSNTSVNGYSLNM